MPRYDKLRDLLPSLYRPDDDDASGEVLPLRAADVLAINGAAPPQGALTESGLQVMVHLNTAQVIQTVLLKPGRAAGDTLVLELYRLHNGQALSRAGAVAPVVDNLARLPYKFFNEQEFALRLKRPGLLTRFLKASAGMLDEIQADSTNVLQAHWFTHADSALFAPYAVRYRQLSSPPQPTPHPADPSLDLFPYIHDLARLSALMALPPWREPAQLRELVEAYRDRVQRIVALYRNGLGTLDALRAMVEAQLPPEVVVPEDSETPEERTARLETLDRPFTVEEFAPLDARKQPVVAAGPPEALVGPLMRWTLTNDNLHAAPATVYIQGVEPVPGEIDETWRPVIELFQANIGFPRIGIAYVQTLAADETLRLRPAHTSWLGTSGGLLAAESLPAGDTPADPTAPGPWIPLAGDDIPPAGSITALLQTREHMLWAALDSDGVGALWRFDGRVWTEMLSGQPVIHALLEDGDFLLLGTAAGVQRIPLFRNNVTAEAANAFAGTVFALMRAADGTIYLGTDDGLRQLGDDAFAVLAGTAIYAIHQDHDGSLLCGGALGLFVYQPGYDAWYWYSGEASSDQVSEWVLMDGDTLPAETDVFLPPVRAIYRGPGMALWLGTDRGLARYLARPAATGKLAYTTQLEAFPDLTVGSASCIAEDARGLLWFGTSRGLFRFDGRDLWQFQTDGDAPADPGSWVLKGRADALYGERMLPEARGGWRYQRALDQWQRFDPAARAWQGTAEMLRSTDETPVQAILWTDSVSGETGTWDGTTFSGGTPVPPQRLRTRYKPNERRVVNGGIPAVPRVPPGKSTWRYLAMPRPGSPEPASRPAWTSEGRLLPPPANAGDTIPGRYDLAQPWPRQYDAAVYAYNPAARVWMTWQGRERCTVLVRLRTTGPDDAIDPAILERVEQGIARVRPAGVHVTLAVDETILGE